jgi:hypothetical protein
MSDTSSNLSKDEEIKQVNFSTDYMVSVLKNSDKLVPEDKIIHYDRDIKSEKIQKIEKIEENNDSESMSEYINNKNSENDNKNFYNKNSENDNKNFYNKMDNNSINFNNNGNNIENNKTNLNNSNKNEDDDGEEDVDDYNILSESKKRRKRMAILRELGEIVSTRGIKLTKMYGVESNYFEMKYELEYHKGIINKSKAVSWMSGLLFTCVDGIEIFSESYGSSYGIGIKGWKEKMNSDINDYYDVLGELYTKYNQTGKSFSPEMRLVFMILSSGLAVQMEHMNPIKPKSSNISVEDMRQRAKNDRESNTNSLNNKIKKEHEYATHEMDEYRQLKIFEEQQQLKKKEFDRMKKDFEKHENDEKNNNNSNRQDDIRTQLLMMRQDVSKMNNTEKTYPDYNIKTNNVENNIIKNVSEDFSLNSTSDEKIDIIEKEKISNDSSNKNDSKNDSSKNNSKNKSMYSKKSYKRGGGITIKTK